MPARPATLLNELWRLQEGHSPETWYGIKITICPDGRYGTEYNYDPDCLEKMASEFLDS